MTKAHKIIGFSALALGVLFLFIGIGHSENNMTRAELCENIVELLADCIGNDEEACDLLQVREDRYFGKDGGEATQDCRPLFPSAETTAGTNN